MNSRLRDARKQSKYTLKELGKMIGVSEATMSNYETGRREPDSNTLCKLAEILGVSTDYLLGVTPDPAPRTADQDEEYFWLIRERLRRCPSYRLLFDSADKASPEHLRAAAAMLKALNQQEENEE